MIWIYLQNNETLKPILFLICRIYFIYLQLKLKNNVL